jgi:hypothetical protein
MLRSGSKRKECEKAYIHNNIIKLFQMKCITYDVIVKHKFCKNHRFQSHHILAASRLRSGWSASTLNTESPHPEIRNQILHWRALEGKKKLSTYLLTLGRKQCRLVTGLLTGQSTLWWYLYVMGPLDDTRDYWVFGLYPSSGILKKLENTAFRKVDLFPSSGERRDTMYVCIRAGHKTSPCTATFNDLLCFSF